MDVTALKIKYHVRVVIRTRGEAWRYKCRCDLFDRRLVDRTLRQRFSALVLYFLRLDLFEALTYRLVRDMKSSDGRDTGDNE